MTDVDEQISALSRSVNALDGARRVGFGRAFTAEAKLADTERDLNMARSDREIFRRSASWLYGFIEKYLDAVATGKAREVVTGMIGDPRLALDGDLLDRGREDGLAASKRTPLPDVQGRADRAERARHSSKLARYARDAAERRLAIRYGFADRRELIGWLDEVRGRHPDDETERST